MYNLSPGITKRKKKRTKKLRIFRWLLDAFLILFFCFFVFLLYAFIKLEADESYWSHYVRERNEQYKDKGFLNLMYKILPADEPRDHVMIKTIVRRPKRLKNCADLKNQQPVVYIKMIKCASTTISNLIKRHALHHHLDIVVPKEHRIYIGWPYRPKKEYILPSESADGYYEVACDHVVYDSQFFNSIMKFDAKYVASIRHPFSQFKSMVNYYNVLNISGVPHLASETSRFKDFLQNIKHYDKIYKLPASSRLRYCVPDDFSMTRNLMSFNLGFPHLGGFEAELKPSSLMLNPEESLWRELFDSNVKLSRKQELERLLLHDQVTAWLDQLEKDFDLIIIVERMAESMVLLKRLLCWSTRDILMLHNNAMNYEYRSLDNKDKALEDVYKSWSWVDYELYDRFNKSFHANLDSQPETFWKEVEEFKVLTGIIEASCSRHETKVLSKGDGIEADLVINEEFCTQLGRTDWSEIVSKRRKKTPTQETLPPIHRKFC